MNFLHYQTLAKTESEFSINQEWEQGRSIFGGLTAALVLVHLESNNSLIDFDLRTVNIHFCGPTVADVPCTFRHKVLSRGRSVVQMEGQLVQNGEVKTQIIACFTVQRTSNINFRVPAKKFLSNPDEATTISYDKTNLPAFVQYFDLRYSHNNPPFSGSKDSLIAGWMRLSELKESLSDAAILCLIDVWPPAILPMLKQPAPTSTVTWNVEFMRPRVKVPISDLLYYECSAIEAGQGYAHTEGKIYHSNGELLALNRQMVALYDKVGLKS